MSVVDETPDIDGIDYVLCPKCRSGHFVMTDHDLERTIIDDISGRQTRIVYRNVECLDCGYYGEYAALILDACSLRNRHSVWLLTARNHSSKRSLSFGVREQCSSESEQLNVRWLQVSANRIGTTMCGMG